MTATKIITTYYASYKLALNTNLEITSTGGVGPGGILANYNSTIVNDGRVNGSKVTGLYFGSGGSLINGSFTYTDAVVEGVNGVVLAGGAASVTNFGVIEGVSSVFGAGDGIFFFDGGNVTNGSTGDLTALVKGAEGIVGGTGTVANLGTILGEGPGQYAALRLVSAGLVTNGSGADFSARIQGSVGIDLGQGSGAGSVINFGAIVGLVGQGVMLHAGGNVTNGTIRDPSATIDGYTGVSVSGGSGTVTNYGTIDGLGAAAVQYGVALNSSGTVINGVGTDRTALIEGAGGVAIHNGAGTVKNSGSILATGQAFGADLSGGGIVVNGSRNNPNALIQGYSGLYLSGGSAANFGVISGLGDYGVGVKLGVGVAITNGGVGHTGALIESYQGLYAYKTATVTNYGTIEGAGGTAVLFASSTDKLVVEAASTFLGAVRGGGGTLDLASGTGTISNFAGGNVTVSGSMAATTFQSFGTVEVGAGARFTDTGAVTIAAGQTVNAAGTLSLGGGGAASIVNAGLVETTGTGTLTLAGAVTGTGTAKIGGGTLFAASTFNQPVTFNGTTGVLELAKSQTYTGAIRGFSKTGGTSLDLNDIAFGGSTKVTYSGTATSGTLTVTDGTHTAHILLIGDYRTSTFVAASDGHGGTTIHDPARPAASSAAFVGAMAGMGAAHGLAAFLTAEPWRAAPSTLLAPRLRIA